MVVGSTCDEGAWAERASGGSLVPNAGKSKISPQKAQPDQADNCQFTDLSRTVQAFSKQALMKLAPVFFVMLWRLAMMSLLLGGALRMVLPRGGAG